VIVWHLDRLHRRPVELEEFVTTCAAAGVKDVVTLHGDVNIGNGDGLLIARLMAAVAANESDAKARRSRRKMLELAQAGKPHGGGWRSFGFNDDRVTIRESEAAVIRDLAARALAGESLTSLTRWLQARDVATVGGKPWRTTTLRGLLLSPRICGQRAHQGQVIGPAIWPAIIPVEQHDRLRTLLTDPTRRTNRTARRYLISGLVRCQLCGTTMYSVPRNDERRYLCRSGPDFGGCGRMAVSAEPLEQFVAAAVLLRLDSPALANALAGRAAQDAHTSDLSEQIAADSTQLAELAGLYASKAITAAEWLAARNPIEARRSEARRQITRATGATAISGLVGQGQQLHDRWADVEFSRQVAIVKTVVDHVVMGPAERGARRLDPARFQIIWKL
jgi:site-specific DNA recombinase